jgi:hypothetical protein
MKPAPPPGCYRDPGSRYRLRWWDGRAWTGRTGLDPKWSTTLLWTGLAVPAWFGAVLTTTVASPIAPGVAAGLVAVPIVGGALGWIVAFAVTRRLRLAVTAGAVTLLCTSVLLAFLVVPKAP